MKHRGPSKKNDDNKSPEIPENNGSMPVTRNTLRPIQARAQRAQAPGLPGALAAVPAEVRQAFDQSHRTLNDLHVPHVLVGGIAVGAHGYPYATQDVDYLVPEDAAFEGTVVITFRPGIPIRVGEVAIDYLVPGGPEVVQRRMQECLDLASKFPGEVVVVPPDLLTFMKLRAGRAKDVAAVVELLKVGMDAEDIRDFLKEAGDAEVLKRFERCIKKMEEEEE